MSGGQSEARSWIQANALSLRTVVPGSGSSDLASLRSLIGDARVVGLGEATHDTREFFQLKHRMLEYLVSDLGFTLFAIEAPFPESLAVNHYVLTGEGDARHSLTSMRFYCWDCEEVVELIEWMRRWNAEHDRKVFFYGYDMQSSAPAVIWLLRYLQRRDSILYARIRSPFQPLALDLQVSDWVNRTESEKTAAQAAIAAASDALAAMKVDTAEERCELAIARLHAAVLGQCVRKWAGVSTEDKWRVRDSAMAENISTLLEIHGPGARTVVWAHNAHIQLRSGGEFGFTAPTMGQHLRTMFGKDYVAIGLLFDHGSFGALDESAKMHECAVSSVPGTLDATLAEAGPPILALDLRQVPQSLAAWFAAAPATRCIAGVHHPVLDDRAWTKVDPRMLFDALLFVRETSAAHHNLTAPYQSEFVREAPLIHQDFVNLDFNENMTGWRPHAQPTVGGYGVRVVEGQRGRVLEIFRGESLWSYDVFAVSQAASATSWRGSQIVVRCAISMRTTHDGSSAQLAVRVMSTRSVAQKDFNWASYAQRERERSKWLRTVCRDVEVGEHYLSFRVDAAAESIELALVITGDGCAQFGPITIEAADEIPRGRARHGSRGN